MINDLCVLTSKLLNNPKEANIQNGRKREKGFETRTRLSSQFHFMLVCSDQYVFDWVLRQYNRNIDVSCINLHIFQFVTIQGIPFLYFFLVLAMNPNLLPTYIYFKDRAVQVLFCTFDCPLPAKCISQEVDIQMGMMGRPEVNYYWFGQKFSIQDYEQGIVKYCNYIGYGWE